MNRLRPVVVLAIAALVLPATAFAATRGVALKDKRFSTRSLTISKGTKVRWRWKSHRLHNVTVVKGPVTFRSSTKTRGSFSHVFRKKGTYKILCTVHAPQMRMTITVR
jgi:plastocyanin